MTYKSDSSSIGEPISVIVSLFTCKQGYQLFDVADSSNEDLNIYSRLETASSVFLLYLQYLSLILIETVDFGFWGEFFGWLKVLSDFFAVSDISVDSLAMQIYFFVSISILSCMICVCFGSPGREKDKDNTYTRVDQNCICLFLSIALLLLVPGLIVISIDGDLSFILLTISAGCCIGSFCICAIAGLHNLLDMTQDELQVHLFILKAVIYVPLASLLGEAIVVSVTSQVDDEIEFGRRTIIVVSCILVIMFIADCGVIYDYGFQIDEEGTVLQNINEADLRVAAFILPLFLIERVAFSLCGSILGDEDFQQELVLRNFTDDETVTELPFYSFLAILSFTAIPLILFRPFYAEKENQLQIYPRLSHIILVSFILLRNNFGDLVFQIILFVVITLPSFIFFMIKIEIWNLFTHLKNKRNIGGKFIKTIDDMILFNDFKESIIVRDIEYRASSHMKDEVYGIRKTHVGDRRKSKRGEDRR